MQTPSPQRLDDKIWMVPAPLPVGVVALYVIRGNSATALIDAGFSPHAELLDRSLSEIGMSVSDIDIVINTHGHADHAGANGALRKLGHASFFAHPADASLIDDPLGHPEDLAWGSRAIGDQAALTARMKFLEPRIDRDRPALQWLEAGDVIELGSDAQLEVMHTPGHTHGSISLVLNERMVFTGDAVQGVGASLTSPPLFFDLDATIQSVRKLQQRGTAKLCLAHAFVGRNGPQVIVDGSEVDDLLELTASTAECVQALVDNIDPANMGDDVLVGWMRDASNELQAYARKASGQDLSWPSPGASAACLLLSAVRQRHGRRRRNLVGPA